MIESIDALKTHSQSIARMANLICTNSPRTQKSTRPIKALCALEECNTEYDSEYDQKELDICIYINKKPDEVNRLYVKFSKNIKNLQSAFCRLNFDKCDKDPTYDPTKDDPKQVNGYNDLEGMTLDRLQINGNSILSLTFQLNQLLMLINNPMLFPHQKYAELFAREAKEISTK